MSSIEEAENGDAGVDSPIPQAEVTEVDHKLRSIKEACGGDTPCVSQVSGYEAVLADTSLQY